MAGLGEEESLRRALLKGYAKETLEFLAPPDKVPTLLQRQRVRVVRASRAWRPLPRSFGRRRRRLRVKSR